MGRLKFINSRALQRAQGTIEYLVIIAVVVVLSLVVVGVVITQTQSGANVSSTASEISSKTGLLAISNVSLNAIDKNFFVSLKNNDAESITVTSMRVTTDTNSFSEQLNMTSEKVFKVATLTSCTLGQKLSATVTVGYTTKYGLSKSQVFSNVVVSCENISVNPSMLAGNTGVVTPPVVVVSDTTPPTILLSSPSANAIINYADHNVVFTFSADENVLDCNLYIGSQLVDRNSSLVIANIPISLDANLAAFGAGDRYWDVNCLDANNNKGTAVDRNINYTAPYVSQFRNIYFSTGGDFNFGNYFLNSAVINPPIKPMGELDWNVLKQANEFTSRSNLWDSNLMGVWHFNNELTDASGKGNNGTGTNVTYTTGVVNTQSGSFNGSTSSVDLGQPTGSLNITGNKLTVSVWAYYNGVDNQGWMIGKMGPSAGSWGFFLRSGNRIGMGMNNGSGWSDVGYVTTSFTTTNQWHNYVVVYNGSNVTYYADGQQVGSPIARTGNIVSTANSAKLGWEDGWNSQRFGGYLDDLVVWDRNLSAAEVQQLYSVYAGTWQDANLVAYFKFNSKSGTTIYDSAKGNNGTLTNGADTTAQGLWDTNAGYFDGVNDYVQVPSSSVYDAQNGWTVSAWVKRTGSAGNNSDGSNWKIIVRKGVYNTFNINANNIDWRIQVDTYTTTWRNSGLSRTKLGLNEWHYVTGVYETANSGTIKMYVDGNLENSATGIGTPTTNTEALWIGGGANISFVSTYWPVIIEDLKIYNRSLTATEIELDYNRGLRDSNYVSRIIDSNLGTINPAGTDFNYLILNTNNGVDKNGHIYGNQIEPTVEKDLNIGLVGLWHLNGDTNDSSGKGNNGTWSSSSSYVTGLWGTQAAAFDGTNYISIPGGDSSGLKFNSSNSVTLSIWFNRSTLTGHASIAKGRTNNESTGNYIFRLTSGGGLELYFWSGGWNECLTPLGIYGANSWHHAVLTYTFASATTAKFYLDGQPINCVWSTGSGNNAPTVDNQDFWIGRINPAGEGMIGSLEDVAIWNRALDANSIKELFNKGASRIGAKYRGCVDSTCSANPSWSSLTYPDSNSRISLDQIDGNRYLQYALYPTLYTFPDGNVFPQAFATIRDVNVLYTN